MARIQDMGIYAFNIVGFKTVRGREYDFAINNIPSKTRKILDVGSSGSLFPLKLARAGYNVHVIDSRSYQEKHQNLINITGDICETGFIDCNFDMITCISTLEHVGLSAYGDPEYDKGDFKAMQEFRRVLKDDGVLVITVPFGGEYKLIKWKNTKERIYDCNTLHNLFKDWKVVKAEYYKHKNPKHLLKVTRAEAEKENPVHPSSNLSCFLLKKIGDDCGV